MEKKKENLIHSLHSSIWLSSWWLIFWKAVRVIELKKRKETKWQYHQMRQHWQCRWDKTFVHWTSDIDWILNNTIKIILYKQEVNHSCLLVINTKKIKVKMDMVASIRVKKILFFNSTSNSINGGKVKVFIRLIIIMNRGHTVLLRLVRILRVVLETCYNSDSSEKVTTSWHWYEKLTRSEITVLSILKKTNWE